MSLNRFSLALLLTILLPYILTTLSTPLSLVSINTHSNPSEPLARNIEGRRRHRAKQKRGEVIGKRDGGGKCRIKQWQVGGNETESTPTTTLASTVEQTIGSGSTSVGVDQQYVSSSSSSMMALTTSTGSNEVLAGQPTETASSSVSGPTTAVKILTTTSSIQSTNDKKVFAHFMVGIVSTYELQDWKNDMNLATSYGIDGFALNIGVNDYMASQLTLAYQAAQSVGFLVFISFDFNWYSISATQPVIDFVTQFCHLPGQFTVTDPSTNQTAAYVSSFAGDGFDWASVKQGAGMDLFVVPNWQPTEENAGTEGVDGLYSWYAWPSENNGPIDQAMSTVHDEAYLAVTTAANKLYMTPVSPWFSTHFGKEVSYSKNWLFKSETLWYDRWQQILAMQDQIQFLEIVTWNDYGESHYVGPFNTPHTDDGSSRWAEGMPHDALLEFAKPYIAAFKTGAKAPVIDQDMLSYWYRPHMKDANCDSTDNCGSKPDGWDLVGDTVFVAAFTKSAGTVTVTSGSNSAVTNNVQAGVTMLQVPTVPGSQQFSMTTDDGVNLSQTSQLQVSADCWNGTIYNFNVYSGILSA